MSEWLKESTLGNRSSPAIASHSDAPQRTHDQRLNLPNPSLRVPPKTSVFFQVLGLGYQHSYHSPDRHFRSPYRRTA